MWRFSDRCFDGADWIVEEEEKGDEDEEDGDYEEEDETTKTKKGVSVLKCHLKYSLYFIQITSLVWSPWRAVHTN